MDNCVTEIAAAQRSYTEQAKEAFKGMTEEELKKQPEPESATLNGLMAEMKGLADKFRFLSEKQPWVFSKCSLRGLEFAKQAMKIILEVANEICSDEIVAWYNDQMNNASTE